MAGGPKSLEKAILDWVVDRSHGHYTSSAWETGLGMEQYWDDRGLSRDTIKEARLGYYAPIDRWTIPYIGRDGRITNISFRERGETSSSKHKYIRLPGFPSTPYTLGEHGPGVLITEGEIDALTAYQCLDREGMVVSTGGATNIGPSLLEALPGDARITACFDNDVAGRRAAAKLRERVPSAKVLRLPAGVKDLNQLLLDSGAESVVRFLTDPDGNGSSDSEGVPDSVPGPSRAIPSNIYINLPDENAAWLVESLWMDRALGFVAGIPKALKSTMALHISYCISAGKPFAGHQILRPGPVIIFQEEDNDYVIKTRLRNINAGMGSPNLHLFTPGSTGLHIRLDSDQALEILDEEITRIQPVLVVLDPLANMHSLEDENQAAGVNKILERVRYLRDLRKCSFMIVHHLRKGREDGEDPTGQRMRGSSVFHAKSECALYIAKYGSLLRVNIENKIAPSRVIELRYDGKEFIAEDEYQAEANGPS